MQLTSFIAATALLSPSVFAALNKPTLWGAGISPLIDPSLWKNLAPRQSLSAPWANTGAIPANCYQEAQFLSLNPMDFEVFNVAYSDCTVFGWTFCRHTSATLTKADMIDLFGRLPIRERAQVRHVVAVPGGGSAYTRDRVTVYQGPVGVPSVFQHETSHVLDVNNAPSIGRLSAYLPWLNAIAADTCVTDNYANTNEIEDFAQIGVVALFAAVNPGGMDPAFGNTWHCLFQQFNTWNAFIGDTVMPTGVCTTRPWDDDATVSKTTGAIVKRSISAEVEERTSEPLGPVAVTYYSNLFIDEEERANAELNQAAWAAEAKGTKLAKTLERVSRF